MRMKQMSLADVKNVSSKVNYNLHFVFVRIFWYYSEALAYISACKCLFIVIGQISIIIINNYVIIHKIVTMICSVFCEFYVYTYIYKLQNNKFICIINY